MYKITKLISVQKPIKNIGLIYINIYIYYSEQPSIFFLNEF